MMVAAFPTVKLADCVDLLAGFAFKSQHFTDRPDDIALVKGENVSQGCILWEISKRWSAADWPNLERFHLRSGDVVVAMDRPWVPAGLKWAYIRRNDPKALLVQRCSRLRSNTPRLDQDFLRFIVGGPGFESYVIPITTGVNVPHISGTQILDFEFALPPLPVQQRIAGILSAYDELIENSQRRIKILESLARALYREWFVHFRFPGHENHPRVASSLGEIPQGWGVKSLNDVVEDIVDYRGKTPAKLGGEWSDEGILALSALNVKGGRLVNLEKSKLVDEGLYARWMKNPLRQGDILMTSEAPLGELFYLCKHERYCLSQRLFSIRANSTIIAPIILYLNLESEQTQHELQSRASGATVSGIRQSELRNVPVVVPSSDVQERAEPMLQHIAEEIHTLDAQIRNLRRTRDLLLPRLLAGQIEVEAA